MLVHILSLNVDFILYFLLLFNISEDQKEEGCYNHTHTRTQRHTHTHTHTLLPVITLVYIYPIKPVVYKHTHQNECQL